MGKGEEVLKLDSIGFTERELRQIADAKHYVEQMGAFGTIGHNLLVLIVKMATLIEKSHQFRSDFWSSKS